LDKARGEVHGNQPPQIIAHDDTPCLLEPLDESTV
jgi:hypothetical protein